MRDLPVWLLGLLLCLSSAQAEVAPPEGLLFSADFETGLDADFAAGEASPIYARRAQRLAEGRFGQAARVSRGAELVYDGAAHAFPLAGTLSFHWRMPATTDQTFVIADLAPLERLNYGRFLRLSYNHAMPELYFTPPDVGGSYSDAAVALSVPALQNRLEAGRWYHLAITWDQARGVALHIGGQERAGLHRPWYFGGRIARLGLGSAAGSERPGTAGHEQHFDRVQLFDRWLDPAAIQALAAGDTPRLEPLTGQAGGALMAWRRQVTGGSSASALPRVTEAGLGLRQVGVAASLDVRRRNWHLFDGQRGQRWPGMVAYTTGGEALDLRLRPGQRYDVVQLFGRGPLALGVPSDQPMLDFTRPLLVVGDPALGRHHAVLDAPVTDPALRLRRGGASTFESDHVVYPTVPARPRPAGMAIELNLFERVPWDPAIEAGQAGWERLPLQFAESLPPSPEAAVLRGAHHPLDRTLLLAGAGAPQKDVADLTLPALQLAHLWGSADAARRGLGAVALDLVFEPGDAARTGVLRLDAFDPVTRTRLATSVDVAWERASRGAPVRVRLLLDLQDQVLPAGHRPWLAFAFDQAVTLDLTCSAVAFRWIPVAEAFPEHRAEQLARFSDLFQEMSEGRAWSWRSERVTFLQQVLAELRALDPEDPLLRGYHHWIHPRETPPVAALPRVPEGTPAWAVYADTAIEALKQVPAWWIAHRETPQGEFGANDGINDDTDLVQDWWALHLMRGPDRQLFDSLKRVADRSWLFTMKDGMSWPTTDALHAYEWGINAQTHMALMDYGNPVYFARLLAIARQYERLMTRDEQGRWSFRSWYYGSQYVDVARHGEDRPVNGLLLQPAMLLAWYNGHPGMVEVLTGWTRSMMAQPMSPAGVSNLALTSAATASYDLTGDRQYLDYLGSLPEPHAARYRFTDDLTADIGQQFAQAAKQADLGSRSLHNNNYRELDLLYLAWRGTGDPEPLLEGLRLTLNALGWSLPMLTEAEQSTDRVWAPQRLVNRMVLGGPAMVRNELYPKHAVSWENASGRVVPWVLEQSRQGLSVQIANLEDQPVTVDMRVWRLDHGRYQVRQHAAEGVAATPDTEAVLHRFEILPLTVPARGVWRVTLTQLEALGDHRDRPDLAITADDAYYNRDRSALSFQVHNIGARPSGPFRLRVRAGETVLFDQAMASLDPPLDLWPRQVGVKVWNLKPYEREALVIEIDPDATISEITRVNNRLMVVPIDRPGHDSQR